MSRYRLGINTCFAVKRWPEPKRWAEIVRDRLGLDLVQHSLDFVDLDAPRPLVERQAAAVRAACDQAGLELHSTFTGLAVYSSNLLLHPDPELRARAEGWYRQAIAFTATVGARATGGHVGAYSVADWRDQLRRDALEGELRAALRRLAAVARLAGLEELYVENLAAAREPSTMDGVLRLLTGGDDEHVPVLLCLDVGHQCVPGTTGPDRDPTPGWSGSAAARRSCSCSSPTRPRTTTGRSPDNATPPAGSRPTRRSPPWTPRVHPGPR